MRHVGVINKVPQSLLVVRAGYQVFAVVTKDGFLALSLSLSLCVHTCVSKLLHTESAE